MNVSATVLYPALGLLLGLGSVLAACSDDATTTSSTTSTTSSTTTTSSTSSTGGGGSGGTGGGTGGSAPAVPIVVTAFDPTKGELPEGLITDGSTAYVGIAPTGQILKISLPDGAVSAYGSVPPPPPNNGGFVLGLVLDADKALYVGVASFSPAYQGGIYKIPAGGGAASLYAKDPGLVFPNGLIFAKDGKTLLVSDSASGAIYQVAPDGKVIKWATDPLIQADPASNCKSGLSLGANGIALSGDALYVAVTDNASVVKIPINADGTAGKAAIVVAPDCATLGGADGMVTDEDGSLIVTANGVNALVRVGLDGKTTTLAKGAPLDSPASDAITTVNGERQLIVTNSAFVAAQTPGATPKPSLTSLALGK